MYSEGTPAASVSAGPITGKMRVKKAVSVCISTAATSAQNQSRECFMRKVKYEYVRAIAISSDLREMLPVHRMAHLTRSPEIATHAIGFVLKFAIVSREESSGSEIGKNGDRHGSCTR